MCVRPNGFVRCGPRNCFQTDLNKTRFVKRGFKLNGFESTEQHQVQGSRIGRLSGPLRIWQISRFKASSK